MRTFDFRTPRFTVDFPVRVVVQDSVQTARCAEICCGGMRLVTSTPMVVDLPVTIQFTYRGVCLDIPARVVHDTGESQGVQFLCDTGQQREDIARLIGLLGIDCGSSKFRHSKQPWRREDIDGLSPWRT